MKSSILILSLILITTFACAATGDITKVEVRKDVASWKIDTVKFIVFTKTCEVTYRKVDTDGNIVGEVKILFIDTEFTDLVSAINSGSNIKTTIKNAVKTKLGI